MVRNENVIFVERNISKYLCLSNRVGLKLNYNVRIDMKEGEFSES